MNSLNKLKLGIFVGILLMSAPAFAQEKTEEVKKVNFGYSKNPTSRTQKDEKDKDAENSSKEVKVSKKDPTTLAKKSDAKKDESKTDGSKAKNPGDSEVAKNEKRETAEVPKNEEAKTAPDPDAVADGVESAPDESKAENSSIAKKTREIAKKASKEALLPTEVYKVGINDVLFISLQHSSNSSSRYYTVLNDGNIDYPLAGELVSVAGLTTEEIEELLRVKVTLYKNPDITVTVREHASHKIVVLGSVEKTGEKFLRREAMPLYVIRAEAIVKPNATHVVLKRGDAEKQTFDLNDSKTGEILIQSGDIIEFTNNEKITKTAAVTGFYYVGQLVRQFGRRDFYEGLTLTQAILESGGLRNSKIDKVIIRRKNEEGLLESITYKLKDIKEGKIPDPELEAGDTIESVD